jgi:hypothetical protein
VKHGGAGYAYNLGCRCDACVEAWKAKHRELRARRAAVVQADSYIQHGTVGAYSNHGCRCDTCFQARSEANRRRPSRAKSTQ